MARIFKKSDRITVTVDGITVKLAPLTIHQKVEIQTAMFNGRQQADLKEATRGVVQSLRYSVKGIDGVEDSDGNPYTLKFEGDVLTEECADDLMNLEITQKLTMVCAGLLNGIPKEFTDQFGNALEGVQLVSIAKEAASKNV